MTDSMVSILLEPSEVKPIRSMENTMQTPQNNHVSRFGWFHAFLKSVRRLRHTNVLTSSITIVTILADTLRVLVRLDSPDLPTAAQDWWTGFDQQDCRFIPGALDSAGSSTVVDQYPVPPTGLKHKAS